MYPLISFRLILFIFHRSSVVSSKRREIDSILEKVSFLKFKWTRKYIFLHPRHYYTHHGECKSEREFLLYRTESSNNPSSSSRLRPAGKTQGCARLASKIAWKHSGMHRLPIEHARLLITLERSRARPLLAPSTQSVARHEGGGEFFSSSFVTFVLDRTQRAARTQVVSQSLLSPSTSLRVDRFERPRSFFFFFYFYLTGFYPYLVSCTSASIPCVREYEDWR